MITHPTNRLIPLSTRLRARLRAAVRGRRRDRRRSSKSTARRAHLDLDGALARRAIAAGATVAIDSDCHRAEMLDRQMQFGVMTARRGWVEARHVVNTRPLARGPRVHRRETRADDAMRRARPPPSSALGAFSPLPRNAAAGFRSRRHRLVPDDGRSPKITPRDALSAVFRHRPASSSPLVRQPRLRDEPALGRRRRRWRAADRARRRRAVGSLLAAVAAALLFAGSYTFWSQAVIAEVYALHLLLVA